jgi:DNA-binding transcriptional ArsR family regulator
MLSLSALADPTRRRIVEMLAQGQLPAGEIAKRFDISPPAVSQHLQTLKRAGIVRARVEAQRRIYELDPNGFAELDQWLGNIKQFWRIRLDALEQGLNTVVERDQGAAGKNPRTKGENTR